MLLEPGKRGRWLALVALAVLVGLVEALSAIAVLALLDLVTGTSSGPALPVVGQVGATLETNDQTASLIAILAVFFLFRAGLYVFQTYMQNRIAYATGVALSRRLLRGYLHVPYIRFTRRNSAELIRNAHESTMTFAAQVLFSGISLASEGLLALAICSVMIAASPLAATTAIVVVGLLVLGLLRTVQPRLLRYGRISQDMSKESLKALQQGLGAFRDIKLLGKETFFEDRFANTRFNLAQTLRSRAVLIDIPRITLESALVLFILGFLAVISAMGRDLSSAIPILGLFGYAALRVLPSLNRVVNGLQSLKFNHPLVDLLYEDVLEADAASANAQPASGDGWTFADSIVLRDVCFAYEESGPLAVSGVSLTIDRGQAFGLVGPTGGGKSTLIDLILGLLQPTTGDVLIDGRDLRDVTSQWHHQVALVPQTIVILDDTLRANIALGIEPSDIDEEALSQVVHIAQLSELVDSLPDGLDTATGEHGVRLSGGQRQRIAIARALYRQPEVMVFDEGTSALDNRTEGALMHALKSSRPDLTIIIVAHRLTTVRVCDQIALLSDGRVQQIGSFDTLLSENPLFRSLARHEDESIVMNDGS